jgi:hypothetical protein
MKTEQIRVVKELTEVLENLRKAIAFDLKKKYNLDEIKIPVTISSQILAAKYKGNNILKFEISKIGLNKGILKIL